MIPGRLSGRVEVKDFTDFLFSPDGQDIVKQKFIPVN
jgi:hypothetical protein